MTSYNIQRQLNEQERNEMTEAGQVNILHLFLKDLADKKAVFQKEYRPFDSYSAKLDFEEKLRSSAEEAASLIFDKRTREKESHKIEAKYKFNTDNLDEYGDLKRFEFVKVTDVRVTRLVAGINNEVHIGKRYHFVGKRRGNRISIYVPNEDVEPMEKWVDENYRVSFPERKKVVTEKSVSKIKLDKKKEE